MVGGNEILSSLDGKDQWALIRDDLHASVRDHMLHNIDDLQHLAAVRKGDWKLVFGPAPAGKTWSGWFGPSGREYSPGLGR